MPQHSSWLGRKQTPKIGRKLIFGVFSHSLFNYIKKSRPAIWRDDSFAIGINAWETYVSGFKELF